MKIIITAFGPTTIEAGQAFNSLPDGRNCLWIQLSQPTSPFTQVIVNSIPIRPDFSEDRVLLTVALLAGVTQIPGTLHIVVVDLKAKISSPAFEIRIQPSHQEKTLLESVRTQLLGQSSIAREYQWTFLGWALGTSHALPWLEDPECADMLATIQKKIVSNFELSPEIFMDRDYLSQLQWRHAVFYYAITLAIRQTRAQRSVFIECGVGDGLTAFVGFHGLREHSAHGQTWRAILFDLWGEIPESSLGDAEFPMKGHYADLNLKRTQKNLAEFDGAFTLIQGELPASLDRLNLHSPEELIFVHIDLNVAAPSVDCLAKLFPLLSRGGVILFDDYGWLNHSATRESLNKVLPGMGTFLMLPTGQGLLIKT